MSTSRPKSRARTLVALLLTLAGLAAVGYGTWTLDKPVSDFTLVERIPLDPATMSPEQGLAWIVSLERSDLESDADGGRSMLRLYEDGAELDGHRSHQQIRDVGAGSFSHWRDNLYFSTLDGSDPTTNGRSYELRLEKDPRSSVPGRAGTLIGAGLVATVLAMAVRFGVIPVVGVLAALTLVLMHRVEHRALDAMQTAMAKVGARVAASAPDPTIEPTPAHQAGNTRRLLDGDSELTFVASEALPAAIEPAVVTFAPMPGTPARDGLAQLQQRESGLLGTPDRPLTVRDLHEAILEVRVVAGSELRIEFLDDADQVVHGLELPVRAGDHWQTLRISQPLSLSVMPGHRPVAAVRLARSSSGGDLTLAARRMIISDEMATFRREPHGQHLAEVGQQMRRATYQSVAGELRVAWADPAATVLKGAVAVGGIARTRQLPWTVAVEDAQGRRHELAGGTVTGADGWLSFRAERPAGTEPVTVVLGCDALPADCVLEWAGLRSVDTSRPPRRVLLTLMDTLRADALACYGHPDNQTPALDALADAGVLFEQNYSQTYWTRPSMPSIMSGRYTVATGVHSVGQQLPARYETLAEAFAAAGFYTFANISNTNAGPDVGLEQGFDEMSLSLLGKVNMSPAAKLAHPHNKQVLSTSEQMAAFVEPRLDDLLDEDLLVYVHLMEAHGPYGPWDQPDDFDFPEGQPLEHDKDLDQPWYPHPTDAGRRALYNRDVETMDAGWGAFVERTKARWAPNDAAPPVLAILADHGEFLGEYQRWSHVQYKLVPEVTHTPLIIAAPGQLPAGRRIATPTENIDLAPTLLELAGLSPALLGDVDGASLVTLARTGSDEQHGVAITSAGAEAQLIGMYLPGFGLVGEGGDLDGTLLPDDDERLVYSPRPDSTAQSVREYQLRSAIDEDLARAWEIYTETRSSTRDALWADVDTSSTSMDPQAIQQLKELGYLGDDEG